MLAYSITYLMVFQVLFTIRKISTLHFTFPACNIKKISPTLHRANTDHRIFPMVFVCSHMACMWEHILLLCITQESITFPKTIHFLYLVSMDVILFLFHLISYTASLCVLQAYSALAMPFLLFLH